MKLKTDPFTRLQHIHHISKHATAGSNNQDEDIRASDTVECFYFFGLIASRVPLIYLFFLINCMENFIFLMSSCSEEVQRRMRVA